MCEWVVWSAPHCSLEAANFFDAGIPTVDGLSKDWKHVQSLSPGILMVTSFSSIVQNKAMTFCLHTPIVNM